MFFRNSVLNSSARTLYVILAVLIRLVWQWLDHETLLLLMLTNDPLPKMTSYAQQQEHQT